jgi:hypothetical protein
MTAELSYKNIDLIFDDKQISAGLELRRDRKFDLGKYKISASRN